MHHCPNCRQELNGFAFYCPRCRRPIGELAVEGDLLSVWWLDSDSNCETKYAIKTLKRADESLNLNSVNPRRPDSVTKTVQLNTRTLSGHEADFALSVAELFAELQRPSQEWEIE